MKLLWAIAALTSVATPVLGRINLGTSQCHVDCATGYTGIAGKECTASTTDTPNDFVFSGCAPMCVLPATTTGYDTDLCSTTHAAIAEAQCTMSCATGYRSTGDGPKGTCSSGFGIFSLSGCEEVPSCKLPSPATGYLTDNCQASASSLLTEAGCTVSCDSQAGYRESGQVRDVCATQGGDFQFSGCVVACTPPTNAPGYITTGCTGLKTSEECIVTCDEANHYFGTAEDTCAAANGNHQFTGCTQNAQCTVPNDLASLGYTATDACTGEIFTDQCTGLDCAAGYQRNSDPLAAVCNGATMSFTGCSPLPRCTASATDGYDISNCDTSSAAKLASECSVTCDTGSNYGGTAVDSCATNNGEFELTGCHPRCTLPSPIPDGYTVSGCSGMSIASACTVGCGSGHTGTAEITCPTAGGTLSFSGCAAITDPPKCTLPATTPGYDTTGCNPGRDAGYGITESQCNLQCAFGYTGNSPQAVCSTEGGEFELSGCTRQPTCKLPDDTAGYDTTRCDSDSCGIDTTSCEVQCATGYKGLAADACPADGGDFTLTACAPMCVHPTTTTGYNVNSCGTGNGAITAAECQLTCQDNLVPVGNGPTATCDSPFGVFTFSGCGTEPKCDLPAAAARAGYMTTSCPATSTNMLTESQCDVTCDAGNGYGTGVGTATCDTDGGVFTFSGCTPACVLPSGTGTTGYNTVSCTGTRTSAQCTLQCDTPDYTGTAEDACTTASSPNAEHTFTGCTKLPECIVPTVAEMANLGYEATACAAGSTLFEHNCQGVSCAAGYEQDGTATVKAVCTAEGGTMSFTGCRQIPSCTASATPGYDLTQCDTTGGAKPADQCSPTCATSYSGTAAATCDTNGGGFQFSGCSPVCQQPSPVPTGYIVTSCSGSIPAANCAVSCDTANNFVGAAEVTCPSAAGTFTFSGCAAVPKCTLPATTPGYKTTSCNPGRGSTYGITASQCSVSCAAGYHGSGAAACATDGGQFTLSGCTRDDTCFLPSSTTGYTATGCQTDSSCGITDPPPGAADYATRGEHPAALLLLLVGIMQWL